MQTILEKIKKLQIESRKEKDTFKTTVLTTLYSEAAIVGKNNGNRESNDEEVVQVVNKFLKNANEFLKIVKDQKKIEDLNKEIEIYNLFLPKKISDEELKNIIEEIINKENEKNIGSIMKILKNRHNGLYDGAKASQIIKNLLS